MAKVKLNSMIDKIQGELGDFIFRTNASGTTFISRKPDMSKIKRSPAQKAHQQHFKQAVAYAHLALQDPEMLAYYQQEAQRLHTKPFHLAVSGYFKVQRMQLD